MARLRLEQSHCRAASARSHSGPDRAAGRQASLHSSAIAFEMTGLRNRKLVGRLRHAAAASDGKEDVELNVA